MTRAVRSAQHVMHNALCCGVVATHPVDANGNNKKGRGSEKNREGSLHQTWRRVRLRLMLEPPSGHFGPPSLNTTPGSRSQEIIPRTKHVRYKHRVFPRHTISQQCASHSLSNLVLTWPPTHEHQIICQAEDTAGRIARPFANALHHDLVQLNHLKLASYTPNAHLML